MAENTSEPVETFGPDVIFGMPISETLKMRGRKYEEIVIWEEYVQTDRQHLNIDDIINLWKDVPEIIRKYTKTIILSPFGFRYQKEQEQEFGETGLTFASVCSIPGQIMIYSRPESKLELTEIYQKGSILFEEAAHVMDESIGSNMNEITESKFYSCNSEWIKAMDDDYEYNRLTMSPPPSYYVSSDIERELRYVNGKLRAQREDFAASVEWFMSKDDIIFMLNFCNRYELMVKLLGDR